MNFKSTSGLGSQGRLDYFGFDSEKHHAAGRKDSESKITVEAALCRWPQIAINCKVFESTFDNHFKCNSFSLKYNKEPMHIYLILK